MAVDIVKALPLRPDDPDDVEAAQVSGYSALRGNNTDNRKGGRYLAMASPLPTPATIVPGLTPVSMLPSCGASGQ